MVAAGAVALAVGVAVGLNWDLEKAPGKEVGFFEAALQLLAWMAAKDRVDKHGCVGF